MLLQRYSAQQAASFADELADTTKMKCVYGEAD
jgi:hypothetical protein